ncbi:hypothetical protein ABPG75_012325 [Micractinium tetrahymenae]
MFTHLSLFDSRATVHSLDGAVSALNKQASRLRSLCLFAYNHEAEDIPLPASLINWRGLHSLELSYPLRPELPSGPYLESLRYLEVSGASLACIPAALSSACCLTRLYIGKALALSMEDVGLLASLPALQRLELDATDRVPTEVAEALRQRAPQLALEAHRRDDDE